VFLAEINLIQLSMDSPSFGCKGYLPEKTDTLEQRDIETDIGVFVGKLIIILIIFNTSDSPVAERPRDASCPSVVSFNS